MGIPALIITDLDIKREKWERGENKEDTKNTFLQINSLKNRTTTNKTLKYFNKNNEKIAELKEYIEDDNLCIVYQGKISSYYATSFEEAFILTNYNNKIMNETLKAVKKETYIDIVGENSYENNKKYSYKWQCKLSKSKSDFANELLYRIITSEETESIPKLPKYIQAGLKVLARNLKEGV